MAQGYHGCRSDWPLGVQMSPCFVQVRTGSWGDSGLVSLVSTCPGPCGPLSVTTSQCAGGPGPSPVSVAEQHAGPGCSPPSGVSLLCPHSFCRPRSVCLPGSFAGPELRLGKEELREGGRVVLRPLCLLNPKNWGPASAPFRGGGGGVQGYRVGKG